MQATRTSLGALVRETSYQTSKPEKDKLVENSSAHIYTRMLIKAKNKQTTTFSNGHMMQLVVFA